MMKNLAIILAGGSGTRLEGSEPKQFLELAGKPIIEHTIERFSSHRAIDRIFLVTNPAFYERTVEIVKKGAFEKVRQVLRGGKTRQESSYIGVTAAGRDDCENVLIHDAVRPFVSAALIDSLTAALETCQAVVTALPCVDTILRVDDDNRVREVPDRSYLRRVQTPQAFKLELIRKAHAMAAAANVSNAADDCSLVVRFKLADVNVIDGTWTNIKITYPEDLTLAEKILKRTAAES